MRCEMERWSRAWSGDWNGRGEVLADAVEAARKAAPGVHWHFDANITFDRFHGPVAEYTELDEARERLAISKPAQWIVLRLYEPKRDLPDPGHLDVVFGRETPTTDVQVVVKVDRTQVSVHGEGDNPFTAKATFDAARKVIESKAVTTVPYHLRNTESPVVSSRWTRTTGWIEKHPVLVSAYVGVAGTAAAIAGIIFGS